MEKKIISLPVNDEHLWAKTKISEKEIYQMMERELIKEYDVDTASGCFDWWDLDDLDIPEYYCLGKTMIVPAFKVIVLDDSNCYNAIYRPLSGKILISEFSDRRICCVEEIFFATLKVPLGYCYEETLFISKKIRNFQVKTTWMGFGSVYLHFKEDMCQKKMVATKNTEKSFAKEWGDLDDKEPKYKTIFMLSSEEIFQLGW